MGNAQGGFPQPGPVGTAICETIKYMDGEAMEVLLRDGEDPNGRCPYDGAIGLHYTAQNEHWPGSLRAAKQLLDAGADVNCRTTDRCRYTPLHYACQCGYLEMARLFLDRGAQINAREYGNTFTPLMYAACMGHVALVTLLLERGADPQKMTKGGGMVPSPPMNALDIAVVQIDSHARMARDIAALPQGAREATRLKLQWSGRPVVEREAFDETIRILRRAGLRPTPGVPTTEAAAKAYSRDVRPEEPSQFNGMTSGSTEDYENLKRAARDAARRQDEESGRTPGGDPAASCGRCGRACDRPRETFKACARCRTTRYCGRACQKAHWSIHKKYCSTLVAGRE